MGAVAGVSGVVIGYLTLRQARATLDECRVMLARQAGDGVSDLKAIRDVAVCRYDALAEMSGRLSFSVAMINGLGDGIVLTSINGMTETRTYVRPVVGGRGRQPLSPEEETAVRGARLGLGPLIESTAAMPRKGRATRQPADTL
ncbi:DUF4446 family protein [Nonomuraea sp. NN258]|nr:DUF4446 family protein [Nonomuraea antri]